MKKNRPAFIAYFLTSLSVLLLVALVGGICYFLFRPAEEPPVQQQAAVADTASAAGTSGGSTTGSGTRTSAQPAVTQESTDYVEETAAVAVEIATEPVLPEEPQIIYGGYDGIVLPAPIIDEVYIAPADPPSGLIYQYVKHVPVALTRDVYVNGVYAGTVTAVQNYTGEITYDETALAALISDRLTLEELEDLAIDVRYGDAVYFEFLPEDIPSIAFKGGVKETRGVYIALSNALSYKYNNETRSNDFILDSGLDISAGGFEASATTFLNYTVPKTFGFSLEDYRVAYSNSGYTVSAGTVGYQTLFPEKGTRYEGVAFDYNDSSRYQVFIEKASKVVITANVKETVFDGTLASGLYDIRSLFNKSSALASDSGISRYTVKITPLDGSPSYTKVIKEDYADSLLSDGEGTYGISALVESDGSFKYYFNRYAANAYFGFGLSENLTFRSSVSFANRADSGFDPELRASAELAAASPAGLFRLNGFADWTGPGNGTLEYVPSYLVRAGWQLDADIPLMDTLTLDVSYRSPKLVGENIHYIGIGAGIDGRFGIFDWDLSASGEIRPDLNFRSISSWGIYGEGGVALDFTRSISFFANAAMGYNPTDKFSYEGRAGFSFTFGPARAVLDSSYTGGLGLKAVVAGNGHAITTAFNSEPIWNWRTYSGFARYSYRGEHLAADFFGNSSLNAGAYLSTTLKLQNGNFSFSR